MQILSKPQFLTYIQLLATLVHLGSKHIICAKKGLSIKAIVLADLIRKSLTAAKTPLKGLGNCPIMKMVWSYDLKGARP